MLKSTKKKKKILTRLNNNLGRYLDNASSTPIDLAVVSVIKKELKENYANPGAIHELGLKTKNKLEKARFDIARILNAHANEIIFTSGATESNNLAILGVLASCFQIFPPCALPVQRTGGSLGDKKFKSTASILHIVTTNIEHSSILEVCKHLEKNKMAEVTYVEVEANGIVDPRKIRKAIKSNTILISVMYANNEIGTIQPIREIAKRLRHFKKMESKKIALPLFFGNNRQDLLKNRSCLLPLLHTDATQAINYLPINVEKLGVDLLSFNGAKIYGPKGVGALYKKRNISLAKIMHGGEQEFSLRPGTENLPASMGLAKALEIVEGIKEKETERLIKLRDYFIKKIIKLLPEIKINGDKNMRLPNNINITVPKIPSDLLVLELSARGIYVSEKSACKSGDKAGSYVIRAIKSMQKRSLYNDGSIRFSLGRDTTKKDIDYTLKALSEIFKKLKKWYN